jgi:hypothetical protein
LREGLAVNKRGAGIDVGAKSHVTVTD